MIVNTKKRAEYGKPRYRLIDVDGVEHEWCAGKQPDGAGGFEIEARRKKTESERKAEEFRATLFGSECRVVDRVVEKNKTVVFGRYSEWT